MTSALKITIDGVVIGKQVIVDDFHIASEVVFDRDSIETGYFHLPPNNVYPVPPGVNSAELNGTYAFAINGWGMYFSPFSVGTHTIEVQNVLGTSVHTLIVV